jgi:PAS domain S-box-containing protein
MSTENKQWWNLRTLTQGNSANGVFILSGILVIAVLIIFYAVNTRIQQLSAEKLLELTTLKEDFSQKNQAIKDKVQMAFNNYLLFSDYHRETQRIEALVAAKTARELLDTYKKDIEERIGSQVAAQEIEQLDDIFSTFESTLINQLEPEEVSIQNTEIIQSEPSTETESFDVSAGDTLVEDSLVMDNTEQSVLSESPATVPTTDISVNKKTALGSLKEINDQLYIVDNAVDLLIGQQILNQKANKNHVIYIGFSLIIFILLIATWTIISGVQKRAITIISNDLKHIAKGERPELVSSKGTNLTSIVAASDEIVTYLDDAGLFAKKIGEGDFEYTFNPKSNNDVLGNSLIEMRNRLQEVAREDKIRNWTNEGQAKFGELLRLHNDDLETLGSQLLSNLIDYLNASQGALFVLNGDGEKHLDLLASYANKRRKFLTKQILPGEGLVGQVFEEGKTTYITDLRTDHYNIETGLGESKPSSLLIVPLKEEHKVEGVIEIASLQKFQKHEIAFVEAIGKSIASSFNSGKINETTKRLLEETQEKAEQMKAQEEELRQNMEELAATQEQIERRNKEMEEIQNKLSEERYLLLALLSESKDHIYFKDRDSKFIRVSQSMVRMFKKNDESEIIGKSDFDFGFGEHAKVAFDDEQRIIRTGKPMEDAIEVEKWDDGHVTWVSTTKNPLRDLNGNIVGTFGISRDVTHSKQDEIMLKKNKEWLEHYFHFSPAGFVVMDQHGNLQFVSEKILKHSKKQTDLKFEDIFRGMEFDEFLKAIEFQNKKEQEIEITLSLRDKSKTEISCVAISSGQENEDGTTNIFIIQK